MTAGVDHPERQRDEEECAEDVAERGGGDAPRECGPQPGPIPSGVASEMYAMLAGLCMNPAATNADTVRSTGMYLPMIVRPMTARNAAMPTRKFPSTPESTPWNHPSTPPISR